MFELERHNVSITCYHIDKDDCTVRGLLLNYEECTPKKINEQKQYDGSPMEVEYFENTNSDNLKDEFSTPANRKNSTLRKLSKESTKQVYIKDQGVGFQRKIGIVVTTIVISVLLHLLFYQYATSITCDCEVDIERLHKNLLEEIYNQSDCIDAMVSSLHNRNRWSKKKKVLVYTGTAGVGKTFVVNIAKKHFPNEGIFEIVDINQEVDNIYLKVCCNLVIIDNLNATNVVKVITLLNFLPETMYSLIVVVFNVQKTDRDLNYFYDHEAVNTIDREFAKSSLYFTSCNFDTLDNLTALIWLKKEFTKRRINETLHKNITDYVLANSNFTKTGFKRLGQKLSLAAEIFNAD